LWIFTSSKATDPFTTIDGLKLPISTGFVKRLFRSCSELSDVILHTPKSEKVTCKKIAVFMVYIGLFICLSWCILIQWGIFPINRYIPMEWVQVYQLSNIWLCPSLSFSIILYQWFLSYDISMGHISTIP
jgi:hypothetical protein